MAAHSGILVWKILWTEELCTHSPWGLKVSNTTEQTHSSKNYQTSFPLVSHDKSIMYVSSVQLLSHV